jgi:hypothetical protein
MAKIDKARFWTGVLYPENMREDWKEVIGDTLQYPYAYCQHSQDKDRSFPPSPELTSIFHGSIFRQIISKRSITGIPSI